jgi:hypothetical protein
MRSRLLRAASAAGALVLLGCADIDERAFAQTDVIEVQVLGTASTNVLANDTLGAGAVLDDVSGYDGRQLEVTHSPDGEVVVESLGEGPENESTLQYEVRMGGRTIIGQLIVLLSTDPADPITSTTSTTSTTTTTTTTPTTPPASCVDFDNLPQVEYYPGAVVPVNAGTATVLDFSGGEIEVDDDHDAGGSDVDLWFLGASLHFGGQQADGWTITFRHNGGQVNLVVNGDAATVGSPGALDGQIVGGATISVVGGDNRPGGVLRIDGTDISEFAIGGQELAIDDVCPISGTGEG